MADLDIRQRNEEALNVRILIDRVLKTTKSNSPELLTALGVTGVVTTAYLTAKASFKASSKLSEEAPDMPMKDKVSRVWQLYIPAGISGTLTIGCVVCASRTSLRRTGAAVAAYSLTERAFTEYKEKVVEQIGQGKEQKLRDELAQDYVSKNPPSSTQVIVAGSGHVMCCELYTKRYFRSSMEDLRRAENDLNKLINQTFRVSLSEFYDLIDLPYTSQSSLVGWESDKLLELQFSTVMSEGGEPCLAFDYNYVKPLY